MMFEEGEGGGNPSYKGYVYQKLVTVWIALELMFGSRGCTAEVVVEPASHDDVKADLAVLDEEADTRIETSGGDELHIQIKYKGAGYWSGRDFAEIVDDKRAKGTRGPAQRARAKALLLREASRRYLFVTNVSVDRSLARGRVSHPSDRPDPSFVPPNLQLDAGQRASLAGRFTLMEHMTATETRRRIDDLLEMRLRVPGQTLDGCVRRLMRVVEDRLSGVHEPIRKAEIAKIAEGFGGLPHADPRLAAYVAPGNRGEIDDVLSRFGAVALIGPPGYGKSLTAEKLVDERRRCAKPWKVVRKSAGLGGVQQAFAEPGHVLFHLDDPWGQSGLKREEAAEWTSALPALIRARSSEKQFLMTSRSEIFGEAFGARPSPFWDERTVRIDDASYDDDARRRILYEALSPGGTWRQDLVRRYETELVESLRSPLEISTFSRLLNEAARPSDVRIARFVDRALTDSRKDVIAELVRAFGDRGIRGAAVLWALLRDSGGVWPDRLAAMRRRINPTREIALDDLASRLAQSHLATDGNGVLTAHSTIVEALEDLARTHSRAAEEGLNAAARAVCNLCASDPLWLVELQRLVDGARELGDEVLEGEIADAFDRLLIAELQAAVGQSLRFRSAWRAGRRLTGETGIARLIDWLTHGASRKRSSWVFGWRHPRITTANVDAVRAADPELRILRGFVAHVLPWTNESYDADELLPWLGRFETDLTEAFLVAGKEVVLAKSFVASADAISEGALARSDPPYATVWMQILKVDEAADKALNASLELRRQARQCELDFDEQLEIERQCEEGDPSTAAFAKGYVRARRRQAGYSWFADHDRQDLILPLWADAMRSDASPLATAELEAFFAASSGDDCLLAAGLAVIGDRRIESGRGRVSTALRTGGPLSLRAAVRAMVQLSEDDDGEVGRPAFEGVLDVLKYLPVPRAAMLAREVVGLEHGKKQSALASQVLAACSPETRTAVRFALAVALEADADTLVRRYRELSRADAELLISDGPRKVSRRLLLISARDGVDVFRTAEAWARSEDPKDARIAIAALSAAIHIDAPRVVGIISEALGHADFEVRRDSLLSLAPSADDVRRRRILKMADDPSAPVRAAVAWTIGKERWNVGIDTLLVLVRDTRDYAGHHGDYRRPEYECEVARSAAWALSRFHPLPGPAVASIIRFLDAELPAKVDVELRAMLLGLFVESGDSEVWYALGRALADDNVVGASGDDLYPARYAAAWTIFSRLRLRAGESDCVDWPAVEAAAEHIDSRLAAPALLALGIRLADKATAATLQALRGEHSSELRVALALAAIADRAAAREVASKYSLLPADHPLLPDDADDSVGQTAPDQWPLPERGREFLRFLDPDDHVSAVLLWIMRDRTGMDFLPEDFDPAELPRRTHMPVATLAELLGME